MSSRHSLAMTTGARITSTAPLPAWLSPHLAVMTLVFAGALIIGYLLLPDENERIAMLERDGHDGRALEILEQRFVAGDRKQRTLFQLQNLYEAKGDIRQAGHMLELLAAARPRDPNVLRRLAEFYRMTQDETGYIRALEQRLAGRFSQPVCKELIGIYRRAGNFENEQRTLTACRAKGYRRTDDMIRLAHLTAADSQLAEAAVLLRAVDDRRQLRNDSDRLMLFSALLDAGGADEAKRRAARWFKGSKDDALVLQIIDTLAAEDRHELAIDLAREVGRSGDSISLAVAELMLDRDEILAARSFLRGWLQVARLEAIELGQRALRAALDAEDPGLAFEAARKMGPERLPQDDLISLAEALSAVQQTAAFEVIRNLIAPDNVRENLLLAAAVEVEQGKPEPARQLLSKVQVKALDDWRLALWARLMASTGRHATAQQTLRDIAAEVRESELQSLAGEGSVAPTPVGRPVEPLGVPVAIPARRSTSGPRRLPQIQPGDTALPPKLIRRHRVDPGKSPRRSRLRKAPPPPATAAPKGPGQSLPVPFPNPG